MSAWGPCGECGAEDITVYCNDPSRGESGPVELTCENGHAFYVPGETTARTRIGALRQINRTGMAARVDGFLVDIQTANMLCVVYDALSPANREKFGKPSLERLVSLGWSVVR